MNEAGVAAGRNAQYAAADCGAFMPLLRQFNGVVQVCAKVTRCAAELGANARIYAAGNQVNIIIAGIGSPRLLHSKPGRRYLIR